MKQSDILSFAINGVRNELSAVREEVIRLEHVLKELQELDNAHAEPEPAVGRPAGFVPNEQPVCSRCGTNPCICVGM